MDTKVREFFRERYKITGEEALSEMEKLTEFVEMKRGDILMAQGEIPKKVFFQIDGIIRGFFVDEDGKGIIRNALHGSMTFRQCRAAILAPRRL